MKKIIIIGSTCSGKSTLAGKLSKKLAIPHIQLDSLFWKTNWEASSDEDFFKKIKVVVSKDQWIVDGNYGRAQHLSWALADTVIWIDLPFWMTFFQSLKRSLTRALSRNEIWPGTGNRESLWRMFSRDSIIVWLFKTYDLNKLRFQKQIEDPRYNQIKFYRLRSRKEMNQFLEDLSVR
jgi:adenylate kinase family enzyme